MYKHITIYTLFLLLLIACGSSERGRMLAVLDEADSLNRNYIPFTTDSALKIAAEWFDSHGSANERMRAHYLLGCAYRDMGEAPAALQCYHDAINCADTTATDCDYRLLSRVHGQMGNLFYEMNLPYEQKSVLNNAIKYSLLSGDTLVSIICYESLYNVYHYLGMEDSCLAILLNSRQLYLMHGYNREAAICAGNIISTLVEQGKFIQARSYIDIYEKESGMFRNNEISEGKEIYYYIKGRYYLGVEKTDSAELMFRRLLESGKDINDKEAAFYGLSLLYKKLHNNDSVAKYSLKAYDANDKQKRNSIEIEMQQMQSQYDYTRHQQIALEKSEEVSKFKSILFVVIFCVICVLYCTISIIRKYNRERREMEKQHKSDVQELLLLKNEIEKLSTANLPLIIEEKTKRIHELQSKIDEYQTKNYKKLNDVNLRLTKSEIYKHFRDYCLAPHKCEITVEDWDTLVGLLNNEVPTFFQLLTVNTQSLRKLDIYLCILVRLHFQPKDISIILDISQSEVSVLRRRLLKKIFNCDGSAKDFDKKIQSISD